MPSIQQVREALAEALDDVSSVEVYPTIPGNANGPAAVVGFPSIGYHEAMGNGLVQYEIPVYVLVGRADDIEAQGKLEDLVSSAGATTSLKAVVEADQTLGSVVDASIVDRFEPFDVGTQSSIGYWGGILHVRVWAVGT